MNVVCLEHCPLVSKENVRNERMTDMAKGAGAKAARKSGLFDQVLFNESDRTEAPYVLDCMILADSPNGTGTLIMAGVCGATLTLVPCSFRYEYTFTGKVLGSDGKELAAKTYKESVRTWMQLFMLPFAGRRPDAVQEELYADMFRRFLMDLEQEKLIGESSG